MTAIGSGVVALLLAGTLPACAAASKQHMTDAITASVVRAVRARTATGTMAVSVTLVKTTQPTVPGPPRILPVAVQAVPTSMDFVTSRAAVGRADASGTPAIIFDGSRLYQHRSTTPTGSAGAATNLTAVGVTPASGGSPTTGLPAQIAAAAAVLPTASTASDSTPANNASTKANRRPWLELDFNDVPKRDSNRTAGSLALSPDLIVLLLRGSLTGSVRRAGPTQIGGASAMHYKMNVSLDKTEAGFSDAARQLLDKIFRANAIHGRVYKAEVWIGEDSLPRRIVVNVRQQLDHDNRADLRVQLDLTGFGVAATVQPPSADQIARVTSLGQLVHAAVA